MHTILSWVNDISWAETKNFAEAVALFFAASFFVYKVLTGYQIINLSVKPSCFRRPSAANDGDYLAINVTLIKGDRGSLDFFDFKIRVTGEGEPTGRILSPKDIKRLSYSKGQLLLSEQSQQDRYSEQMPFLRLTPGDEILFSSYCKVERDKPCLVEVAIMGKKRFHRKMGQWRASCVSLPGYNDIEHRSS